MYASLTQLSLKENNLSHLGKDIHKLKKLKTLDISGNPIESVQDVLEGLMGLPALKEFSMDIRTEEDVVLLLRALPRLQILNGKRIDGEPDDSRGDHTSRLE